MSDNGAKVQVLSLPLGEDSVCSLVKIAPQTKQQTCQNVYNICMVDVSGSMMGRFECVMKGWNEHIADRIVGRTSIYTFGSTVQFKREGRLIEAADFTSGGTDLTGALAVIRREIEKATENLIRVFLVTDGGHNASNTQEPPSQIDLMKPPGDKTVEVYLLGIGNEFPVEYSVNIRSKQHNGSSTIPTLFWSTLKTDIEDECSRIAEEMAKATLKVKLSIPGRTLPLVDEDRDFAYSGEYLIYDVNPNDIVKELRVTDEDGTDIPVSELVEEVNAKLLVGNIFKQWNSVLIQRHRNKLAVPMEVFDLMKKAFAIQQQKLEEIDAPGDKLTARLLKRDRTRLITDFNAMMNQSYKLISIENKFENEIELANAILNSAVQGGKYDTKLLSMRGHGDEEWKTDVKEFKKIYILNEAKIKQLPEPEFEDSCRILLSSFVSDLIDDSFPELLDMNKMEFLANISITGIPAFAPIKDSTQINSWTLRVKNICTSPFEILSQRSMETSLAVKGTNMSSTDKEIILQADNPNSKYNIIVPIIPKKYCNTLKPLVRTNLFSVAATFSILKNPLIVDNWCHFAALACVWMKSVEDYPATDRPDFVKRRIADVEETAKLYLDRKGIATYMQVLIENPEMAVMTESTEEYDETTIKCESLIKPAFFLHLMIDKIAKIDEAKNILLKIIKLILIEFIGRCLKNNTSNTVYTTYFTSDQDAKTSTEEEILNYFTSKVNMHGIHLLKEHYSEQDLEKNIKIAADNVFEEYTKDPSMAGAAPTPSYKELHKLNNYGSAGNVSWKGLKAWAKELVNSYHLEGKEPLITTEEVDELFSTDNVFVYLDHALMHRNSSERCTKPLMKLEDVKELVAKKLKRERNYIVKKDILTKLVAKAATIWRTTYIATHTDVALPLTKHQIISRASALGIPVNSDNFASVYKYRESVGLCRNCCHVEKCPHFLKPNKRFNCHIEAERKGTNYPHTLHVVVSENTDDIPKCMDMIQRGSVSGTRNRKKLRVDTDKVGVLENMVNSLTVKYKEYNV